MVNEDVIMAVHRQTKWITFLANLFFFLPCKTDVQWFVAVKKKKGAKCCYLDMTSGYVKDGRSIYVIKVETYIP